MLTLLGRLFNIRQDEWRRLILLIIMLMLFVTGGIWANITIIAQFLSELGSENVPYLLIGDAFVIVLTFAIYSSIADRFSNGWILAALILFGIVGVLACLYLIVSGFPFAYLVLYMLFRGVTEAISVHWGVYVNDFFDTRAAKRIFTLLGAVVRVANIVAALTIPLLNQVDQFGFINDSGVFILSLWVMTLVAMLLMVWLMPRLVGDRYAARTVVEPQSNDQSSYVRRLQQGASYVLTSNYLRMFSLMTLLMMVLMAMMQFKILEIFSETFNNDETAIANFISFITLVGSLLVLPFQLFVFNRLVSRYGVESMNVVFPFTSLIASILLAIFPASRAIGAIAEFNRNILNGGIRSVNDEFLYNAIPLSVKGRTRGFLSGIVQPLGTLLGGLAVAMLSLPLLDAGIITTQMLLPILLVLFGVGYFLSSISVSRLYGRALIEMIEQENYAFLLDSQNRVVLDNETIQSLEVRLKEAESDDVRLILSRLLIDVRREQALPGIMPFVSTGGEELRAGIIDAFVSADVRSPEVIQFLTRYVDYYSPVVRRSAIIGLRQLSGVDDEQYLMAALRALPEEDPALQLELLPDLINSQDFFFLRSATGQLNRLLEAEDAQQRAFGVQILGQTKGSYVVLMLMQYLQDKEQVVRLQAALAIETITNKVTLSETLTTPLHPIMLNLLNDPVDQIRLASVHVLGILHQQDLVQNLTPALIDPNLEIRDAAVAILRRQADIVSELRPRLESAHGPLRRMAAVVLVQVRSGFDEYIYQNIDEILAEAYLNHYRIGKLAMLEQFPSVRILCDVLLETNQQIIDETFYMLGAVHGTDAVKIAADALRSSNERNRANAIEAIDVMMSQRLLDAFIPLTDNSFSTAMIVETGRRFFDLPDSDTRAVLEDLLHFQAEDFVPYIVLSIFEEFAEKLAAQAIASANVSPLDLLMGASGSTKSKQDLSIPYTIDELEYLLRRLEKEQMGNLYLAVRRAQATLSNRSKKKSDTLEALGSAEVDRVIFLKRVAFFQDMNITELRRIASVCVERVFPENGIIFHEGVTGGQLYIIMTGRVGIESRREGGRSARLRTLEPQDFFGEDTLFDLGVNTTSALALSVTRALVLNHDAMLGVIQAYPNVSRKIIKALSQEVHRSKEQLAGLTRADKTSNLFDMLDTSRPTSKKG